jgi:hypothetical protein
MRIAELEIWQAAQQIIDNHPADPERAAFQFADSSWQAGDKVSFQRCMRIAAAVQELVRTKPHCGKAIN